MNRQIVIFLILASIIRLGLALLFPITADESYYWLWSKHLSLSYVDHPPMIALVNFLFTGGTANLLLLRLGVVVIALLVSILIYLFTRELFDERTAFWSVVLFQVLPHFVVVWSTQFVELPLILFWSLALLLLARLLRGGEPKLWYLIGLTVGLATLSKYTAFLFWPGLLIFFYLSPEDRFWLKRPELYLCLLLSALLFSPVLVWNAQHQWASFAFHGTKVTSEIWVKNALPFVADQLVHFTPFLIFALFNIFNYSRRGRREERLLFAFGWLPLILFFLLSFKIKVWAHWPSLGYVATIPLTVNYLLATGKSLQKFLTWVVLFTGLVLLILFFVSPGVLLHQADYAKNRQLAKLVPSEYKLFAKTNVAASLLEFYTGRQTYLATGPLKIGLPWGEKQYELWGIPEVNKGETVLYYGDDNPQFEEKAAANFELIRALPSVKLYLIEDYITNNYNLYLLEGYKGTAPHP
jgi:4-amino-4-deoxy-L-arabinose transferase-like glycosyltransferase